MRLGLPGRDDGFMDTDLGRLEPSVWYSSESDGVRFASRNMVLTLGLKSWGLTGGSPTQGALLSRERVP